jgi:hypothetical protein
MDSWRECIEKRSRRPRGGRKTRKQGVMGRGEDQEKVLPFLNQDKSMRGKLSEISDARRK